MNISAYIRTTTQEVNQDDVNRPINRGVHARGHRRFLNGKADKKRNDTEAIYIKSHKSGQKRNPSQLDNWYRQRHREEIHNRHHVSDANLLVVADQKGGLMQRKKLNMDSSGVAGNSLENEAGQQEGK